MRGQSVSARQRQLCDAIERLSQARGYGPSQRELAEELGVSLARVSQLVAKCEADGLLTRLSKSARTCRVVQPQSCGGTP